ncbi:MAG: VIT1/CCC1 transporter family protein [Patescibacteria group bacterium]|jgi:VIT1/CCC1 family predicted Fe2+/Mn2+ transporter
MINKCKETINGYKESGVKYLLCKSIKTGFSFGLTSGVITTLGLIMGIYSSTHSRLAIIGGIITIAIADSFSDALGIHISEESQKEHTEKEIWQSTIATLLSKAIFASSFIFPFVLFSLGTAALVSFIYGFLLLGIFSYFLGEDKKNSIKIVGEHLFIMCVVLALTYSAGIFIGKMF